MKMTDNNQYPELPKHLHTAGYLSTSLALYTAAQMRQYVDADRAMRGEGPAPREPLTEQQISDAYFEALGSQHLREQDRKMVTRFARAIEAAHGIQPAHKEQT